MKDENSLTYSNQLEFKAWARRSQELSQKNGCYFYFDSTQCVHDTKGQPDIKTVRCDGSMTWGEAAARLREYFHIV